MKQRVGIFSLTMNLKILTISCVNIKQNNFTTMKSHNISLLSSLVLIVMSAWGYLSSETPSVTALIPLFFGVILIICYPGIKKENKIIAHIAVSLTLLVFLALFMPLKGAFGREDNGAVLRIFLMISGAAISLFGFIKSFINARKAKENN